MNKDSSHSTYKDQFYGGGFQVNNLKMRVWNINGQSGRSIKRGGIETAYTIPSFITSEIIGKELTANTPDIIVLTEFVNATGMKKLESEFDNNGYRVFTSPESGKNGILIALKENEEITLEADPDTSEMNTEIAQKPNFHQVSFKYKGKPLTIIGARIRVNKKLTRKEFLERKEQLDALIEHLSQLDNFIVGGDFNNAKINGDETKRHSEVKEKYRYTSQGEPNVSYDTYNYHKLKDTVEDAGYGLHTPKGNVSSMGYSFKLDHFITSKSIAASNVEYSWSFKKKVNGYGEFAAKDVRLPDHAILSAEISIN